MTTYSDVFGNYTLPPSEYGYVSLTMTDNQTAVWPYNSDGGVATIAKVLDVSCLAGNVLTLPDARQVSVGEDFLLRNVGSNTLTVNDAAGVQVATVAVGAASYFYLTDNTTEPGVFGVIGFGVGTSSADAASLVGYGIKAVGASLNQAHVVVPSATGITLDATYRSKLVVFTGGTGTFSLTSAAVLGNDYFVLFRNDGTGTATIDPAASETLDGLTTMQVQPGESLILICTGTEWYSVGYGRSTLYQFTQLTKDVSAGGTITLTAAEASNKLLTFVGNPGSAVTVVVPAVVAVYYTYSSISTSQTITVKTASGSGASIPQGARIICICDGTDVLSAQSAVANVSLALTDGSSAIPSLYFSSQTNTGLYKYGTQELGVTVDGTASAFFNTNGLVVPKVGPSDTQQHAIPGVAPDTFVLANASQAFGSKTFDLSNNTLTGTTAQFNAALSDGDFATLAGTETLTNKTVNLSSNTLTGTTAQFNSALSDGDFATQAGAETLTNKTVNLSNNTLTGTITQFNTALSDGDFATQAGAETLTNKTVSLSSNTLTGTLAQFNTALSDGDFATLAGSETLTNKTVSLSSNTLSGTLAQFNTALSDGDFATLAGTETLSNKNILVSGSNVVEATSGPGLSQLSFRNKLINGGFTVSQRGSSQTQAVQGYHSVDRWYFGHSSGTYTVSAGFLASVIPNGRYLNITATSLVGGYFYQVVEDVESLQGKTVTLSFYFGVNSGTNTGGTPILRQRFGSGGSADVNTNPSSDVTVGNRRILTYNLPSTSGKTIGAGSGLMVLVPLSGTFNISWEGFQLEEGNTATPFENRPQGLELSLCQRYCCRTSGTYPGQCYSSASALVVAEFPVTMRNSPTAYGVVANGNLTNQAGGAVTVTSIGASATSFSNAYYSVSVASGLLPGNATLHTGGSIIWEAELN